MKPILAETPTSTPTPYVETDEEQGIDEAQLSAPEDIEEPPEGYEPVGYKPAATTPEVVSPVPEPKKRKVVINAGDDMSDMFEVPKSTDADMDISDLTSVDVERDILDGDLSDVTDVDLGDIIGGGDADMSDDVLDTPEHDMGTVLEHPKDVVEVTQGDIIGGGDADMSDDVLSSPQEVLEATQGDIVGDGDANMLDDILAPPGDDILAPPETEDFSDLLEVDTEDIMGEPPTLPQKRYRATRPSKRSVHPVASPPSLGEVRR